MLMYDIMQHKQGSLNQSVQYIIPQIEAFIHTSVELYLVYNYLLILVVNSLE